MESLPEGIVWMDQQLNVRSRLTRAAFEGGAGGQLLEKDYDRIIAAQGDAIADALLSAGVVEAGTKLRLL
jgi:hypothetical protein